MVGLPLSASFLKIKNGNVFTYHQMAGDAAAASSDERDVQIDVADDGTIRRLHDGKRAPLALGSMPRGTHHVMELKEAFGLHKGAPISIHSINCLFECSWCGLCNATKACNGVTHRVYPTIDHCAPSMPDTLCVLRDLHKRDEKHSLSLVNCLGGHGRSVTVVAAYIMSLLHEAGYDTTVDAVEDYIWQRRPQIGLNSVQKRFLSDSFQRELREAGSLKALCMRYADAMQARDDNQNALRYEQQEYELFFQQLKVRMLFLLVLLSMYVVS